MRVQFMGIELVPSFSIKSITFSRRVARLLIVSRGLHQAIETAEIVGYIERQVYQDICGIGYLNVVSQRHRD